MLLASTSKLSDVAAALELSLGLTRANATRLAARVASTAPRVVASTASAKVHQRATFLCKELGLSPERAAAVVNRRPQSLGLSVEKNLRPACAWLASELLGGPEKVASLQEIDADKPYWPEFSGRTRRCSLSVEKTLKPKLRAPDGAQAERAATGASTARARGAPRRCCSARRLGRPSTGACGRGCGASARRGCPRRTCYLGAVPRGAVREGCRAARP